MRRVAILFILVVFMLSGLFVPVGHQGIQDQDIADFGETQPDGTLFEPSADGDMSSQSLTSFSETIGTDVALDSDSDTSGSPSYSEWGFGETSASDTPLDPDSDTSGSPVYSVWDFSETLADNILFYPDVILNDTEVYCVSGDGNETLIGTHDRTHTVGGGTSGTFYAYDITDPYDDSWVQLNYTIPSGMTIEGFDYSFYIAYGPGASTSFMQVYNWTSLSWDNEAQITSTWPSLEWHNGTYYSPDYWSDTVVTLRVKNTIPSGVGTSTYINYAHIEFHVMTLADSDHYAESFIDISDWTESGLEGIDNITTDNDVVSFKANNSGADNDVDGMWTNDPSVTGTLFVEIRHDLNHTTFDKIRLILYTADGLTGTSQTITLTKSATYLTEKYLVTISGVESCHLYVQTDIGQSDVQWDIDYFRISPHDESGWQQDGSTTEGIYESGSLTVTSDGDLLNVSIASGQDFFYIPTDTTATKAEIDPSKYPFLHLRFNDSVDSKFALYAYNGSLVQLQSDAFITRDDYFYNLAYAVDGTISRFYLYNFATAGPYYVDFIQAYGLTNWTFGGAAGDNAKLSAMYYNSTEDALIVEQSLSTSADNIYWSSRNTSIGYNISDMVLLMTVKASANSSLRVRPRLYYSEGDDYYTYYVYDDWQTIAMPISSPATTMAQLGEFYCYDWSTASPSSGIYKLYIKDNITIRPSWYDAQGYWEDMSDVSDWSVYIGYTPTSDGSVMSWEMEGDNNYDTIYSNTPNFTLPKNTLIQLYMRSNTSTTYMQLHTYSEDSRSGSSSSLWSGYLSTSWTLVEVASSVAIECLQFYAKDTTEPSNLQVDYAHITMNGESASFGESFADVSDWTGSTTFTSTGDEGYFDRAGDYVWSNIIGDSISLATGADYYIEFRMRCNASNPIGGGIKGYTGTGATGDLVFYTGYATGYGTDAITKKYRIGSLSDYSEGTVESLLIYFQASVSVRVWIDYIRIAPANETGYQLDSTIAGEWVLASGSDILDQRGDYLMFSPTSITTQWDFDFTNISTNLYPFMEISIVNRVGYWQLYIWDGDGTQTAIQTALYESGVFRYNLQEALTDEMADWLRFYTNGAGIDYIKFYSITNWTYDTYQNLDNPVESVAYFDSTEDALVMEANFSTSEDWWRLITRNTSIGYGTTDMVFLITVKASANNSCKVRLWHSRSGTDKGTSRYLYDSYQTFAIPLDTDSHTTESFWLYIWDWDSAEDGSRAIYVKNNITVRPSWYDASGDSGTYGESFADVSDFTMYSPATISTDGDVASIETTSADEWNQGYTNGPSLSAGWYSWEIRYSANISIDTMYVYMFEQDTLGGAQVNAIVNLAPTTVWKTYKGYANGSVESYKFTGIDSSEDWIMYVDYLRIAPVDEIGYQNDHSVVTFRNEDNLDLASGTGDTIWYNGTGASYMFVNWSVNNIKLDDYQFVEVKWMPTSTDYVWVFLDEDSAQSMHFPDETVNEWNIERFNVYSKVTGDYIDSWAIQDGYDGVQAFQIDYVRFYSIANFSIVVGGGAGVSDVLRVDSSNNLVSDAEGTCYYRLDTDVLYSVDTSIYNVCNVTSFGLDNDNYPIGIYTNVDPVYTTEARFPLVSGTLSSFSIRFQTSVTLSRIEFWMDSTAPVVANFWATPYTPTEEDSVSLAVYVVDWTDVYSATFNAIDSPAGFSDVDYEATKNAEDGGLWTYTWASLDAGYYAMQVVVDDGGQTTTDILVFRVVTVSLQVTDIVLITATETLAQLSGYINKDASYQIWENDTSIGSGSVSIGWFSISWTKDTTAGTYIELGINFTSGIYEEWINGSYSIAALDPEANLTINSWDISWYSSYVSLTYDTSWGNTTAKLYVDTIYNSEASEPDVLIYTLPTDPDTYNITFLIDGGADSITRQYNYTVAAPDPEAELSITAWDIEKGDYYWYVTYASSWGNSTITPYENGLPASSTTENYTLQYEKTTVIGNHTLDFKIDGGGGNIIWKNYTYAIIASALNTGEMRLAFFDTADNWVPFESISCNLTQNSVESVLTSSTTTVTTTGNITLEVFNRWGILISNTTFNYTQFKSIDLMLYELIIDNEADHVVRLDMSYNGTYPNITIMLPRNFPRFLYLASANYTMIFTYYIDVVVSGEIVDYEELTGYYVTYEYELTEAGYLMYTGISLTDIANNIDYTRVFTNNNIDVVDTNVLAIPYPPNVPQNIVTPEMFWLGIGAFGVIAFLFALGGSIFRGRAIAKKARVFYKSQGAVAEEIADAEGRDYYRGSS